MPPLPGLTRPWSRTVSWCATTARAGPSPTTRSCAARLKGAVPRPRPAAAQTRAWGRRARSPTARPKTLPGDTSTAQRALAMARHQDSPSPPIQHPRAGQPPTSTSRRTGCAATQVSGGAAYGVVRAGVCIVRVSMHPCICARMCAFMRACLRARLCCHVFVSPHLRARALACKRAHVHTCVLVCWMGQAPASTGGERGYMAFAHACKGHLFLIVPPATLTSPSSTPHPPPKPPARLRDAVVWSRRFLLVHVPTELCARHQRRVRQDRRAAMHGRPRVLERVVLVGGRRRVRFLLQYPARRHPRHVLRHQQDLRLQNRLFQRDGRVALHGVRARRPQPVLGGHVLHMRHRLHVELDHQRVRVPAGL